MEKSPAFFFAEPEVGKFQCLEAAGRHQFSETQPGLASRRDYEALLARAGDEDAEDAMTARIVRETTEAIARGEDVALPAAVWEAIEGGESPVRVLRKHRGLTQAKLAEANAARNLVRQVPVESQVARWIEEAKALPRVVTH